MSAELDQVIKDVASALSATRESVDEMCKQAKNPHVPQIVQDLMDATGKGHDEIEGVSLLSLKNQALLGYLNNVALVVMGHLQRLQSDDVQAGIDESIKRSIEQRVTVERGIKPLEKKLAYQLDVMLRSYNRMEASQEKVGKSKGSSRDRNSGSDNDDDDSTGDDDDDEDDDNDEDEDDKLSYRPDASALAKLTSEASKAEAKTNEKYKPPRISAAAPPTAHGKTGADPQDRNRKLQSMEEYLREQSDLPNVSSSIGATIVGHGRGGVKTDHDTKREAEIQRYEESNFIRLPNTQTKKSLKQKQRDAANQFGGEDWAMFNENNQRSLDTDTLRKKRPQSAWDRAKKRR